MFKNRKVGKTFSDNGFGFQSLDGSTTVIHFEKEQETYTISEKVVFSRRDIIT